MPLANNDFNSGKDVFYTERYKTLVRSELELIRKEATYFQQVIPAIQQAFKNDFYRFLRIMGVPSYLWWTTAYINGITNPNQDISGMSLIYQVNESALNTRIARNNTARA